MSQSLPKNYQYLCEWILENFNQGLVARVIFYTQIENYKEIPGT